MNITLIGIYIVCIDFKILPNSSVLHLYNFQNLYAYVDVIVWQSTILDVIFLSNHNIHKSLFGLCFWASDPLFERFLVKDIH